jgi:hypothetical protein
MRKHFAATAFVCLMATSPALAQRATAVGTGVGIANSSSRSGAVAISGQGGQGGNSSLTVNSITPAVTTSNVNQTVSGTTTSNVVTTGTQTLKTVPNAYSPGLSAAGLETCLGSISGGGSAVGWGASFGTTIPDPGCNARLDARTLWSIGLKAAAIARLCQSADIYRSMPDICARYMPQYGGGAAVVMSVNANEPIELVDGKTGLNRMCDNYDAARQRCRAWTGEKIRVAAHHPKPAGKPLVVAPAAANLQTPVVAQPPAAGADETKKEN